jgi:hypothetical protein
VYVWAAVKQPAASSERASYLSTRAGWICAAAAAAKHQSTRAGFKQQHLISTSAGFNPGVKQPSTELPACFYCGVGSGGWLPGGALFFLCRRKKRSRFQRTGQPAKKKKLSPSGLAGQKKKNEEKNTGVGPVRTTTCCLTAPYRWNRTPLCASVRVCAVAGVAMARLICTTPACSPPPPDGGGIIECAFYTTALYTLLARPVQ